MEVFFFLALSLNGKICCTIIGDAESYLVLHLLPPQIMVAYHCSHLNFYECITDRDGCDEFLCPPAMEHVGCNAQKTVLAMNLFTVCLCFEFVVSWVF